MALGDGSAGHPDTRRGTVGPLELVQRIAGEGHTTEEAVGLHEADERRPRLEDRDHARDDPVRHRVHVQALGQRPRQPGQLGRALLALLPLGDVAQERAEDDLAPDRHRRDGQLDRKLAPVPAERRQLDPPAEQPAPAASRKTRQTASVGLSVGGGYHRLGEKEADGFVLAPAEQGFRLRIPARDSALRVDRDHGVQRVGDDEPCAILALPERLLAIQPCGHGVGPLTRRFDHLALDVFHLRDT